MDSSSVATESGLPADRGLWLRNPNTSEELVAVFWRQGVYDRYGYDRICYILRDWRENQVMPMDPRLLHLLWAIQRGSGFERPLVINSGYRTVKTNDLLRAEGSAPNSYHLHSQACDIVLDGISASRVADYVQSLKYGGCGRYSNFCHVDSGPIRIW